MNEFTQEAFGVNLYENDPETLPQTQEELELHMQLTYKQAVEIAEEQAIKVLMEGNNYDLIKKQRQHSITFFE